MLPLLLGGHPDRFLSVPPGDVPRGALVLVVEVLPGGVVPGLHAAVQERVPDDPVRLGVQAWKRDK